ncbi:MAG: AI-2E family transporter, partial [Lachnospiraceae bacterium]|nr:AI-2E family transporter [Lachnospiraceae bacterium]
NKKAENNAIENSIKSNAHKLKPYIPICISVLIMFVIFKYWDNAINFIGLFISASSGLIIGIIIAFLVNIIMRSYESGLNKLFKGKLKHGTLRAIGIITSMLTVILIIFGVIKIVIPELINSIALMITALTDNVPKMLTELKTNKYVGEYATNLLNSMPSSEDIETTVQGLGHFIINGASGAMNIVLSSAGAIISFIAKLGIGIFFSIYILADKEKLKRQCTSLVNTYLPGRKTILSLAELLAKNFRNFIVAQVTDACILGGLCIVGMLILRLPYAVMSGVIIAFFALIPIIGAFLGMGLSAFFILMVSPVKALIFLIFIITLQQIDNNFIYPRVVGNKVELPGMWVLAAVTVFGGMFGIVGIMCSVPVTATVYKIIKDDLRKRAAKAAQQQSFEDDVTD